MTSCIENLTTKEAEILRKFRQQVCAVLKPEHDDYYLLKWLTAQKFDTVKAESMLRQSLEWRKRWRIDTLLEDFQRPDVLRKYWHGGVFGSTKEGFPVLYNLGPLVDSDGIRASVTMSDITTTCIYRVEEALRACRQNSKKLGKRIDQYVEICDLEGLSWSIVWSPNARLVRRMVAIFEANYPDVVNKFYIINAPAIFPLLFDLVKPFLSEQNQQKVVLLGDDWKERLLEVIDADQLPVHWGGTCTDLDGNPFCKSRIQRGGEVPTSYYLEKQEHVKMDPEKSKTVTIDAGSSHSIYFEVTKPGSHVRWRFKTTALDIKFGAYQEKDQENVELIPLMNIDCDMIPEEGELFCAELGKYEIRFDNTYSWFNSKEVSYEAELFEDGEVDDLGFNQIKLASKVSENDTV